MQRGGTPAVPSDCYLRRCLTIRRNGDVLRSGQLERAQPIAAAFQWQRELALVAGRQQLLRDDVRRPVRTANAERRNLQTSHCRVRLERQLNIAIEVDGEIDLARVAVNVAVNVFQRAAALLWSTTKRAKQVPLKIEQAAARRTQTNFQHRTSRQLPIVGEFVRANARDCVIVAAFEKLSETLGDGDAFRSVKISDQFLLERGETLQIERRLRCVRFGVFQRGAVKGKVVVLQNRLAKTARDDEVELHRYRDRAGDVTRGGPHFVNQMRPAFGPRLQLR